MFIFSYIIEFGWGLIQLKNEVKYIKNIIHYSSLYS